ncbi:hypothetical protein EV424DRAFT_1109633 [Suillus variegatus]|nr:hypothetical protein EV424DRAFT_1109633 [Suillus variegatus]
MVPSYSAELHVTTDQTALAEEQPLPEALRHTSLLTRSLQSDQAFETIRSRSCSILASTITTATVLLATSVVLVSTASPVSYFNYTSPAPHCLLFISLMLAMMAILTSGSSTIRWLHTDRQWTQEPGGYFVFSYLLSIVTPIFFVAWSLHCFIFAMLIARFCSHNTIYLIVTALWLVMYVVNIGTILMQSMWKYTAL